MEVARLVLDYLRAVLSPQMVAGMVIILAFVMFKNQLGDLFRGGFKLRSPGGYELSSQRERTSEDALSKASEPPRARALPANPTPDQTQQAYRAEAALWEYRYLNYFLARSTQVVLDWLAGLSVNTTVKMFDSWWMPLISDARERRAIIEALQAHHLIDIDGELIKVTEKGREYLKFRGPLPPPPSASTSAT